MLFLTNEIAEETSRNKYFVDSLTGTKLACDVNEHGNVSLTNISPGAYLRFLCHK